MAQQLIADRDAYITALADYVVASPSSYHAAKIAADTLEDAGFVRYDETAEWDRLTGGSAGFVVRDGAIIAWRAGDAITPTSPVRIFGTHTDSPGFVLKPEPDVRADGWAQVGVEVYGGPLLNSWLDRDLGFAGRVVSRGGTEHLVHTGAVARIPQLAIHLDREANKGLKLDRQRHVQPILAPGEEPVSVYELLAAGTDATKSDRTSDAKGSKRRQRRGAFRASDIVGTDVRLFDTQRPEVIGAHGDLLASPRLDNLSSTFAGLAALLETAPDPGTVSVLAAFDHEELGSQTRSGASGPFLSDVLDRLWASLGGGIDERARAMSASWCVSADAGHSVHPNYGEKHDPNVRPLAGAGPMLKINANQRYASDAHGAALWHELCDRAHVATQSFVSNNTVPCGSTIGPLTATRLGIRTVDVGVPLLSMHSARELAHVDDLHGLARAGAAFFGTI